MKITKTVCDLVNRTYLPKQVLLSDWAHWDKQGKKGDHVDHPSEGYPWFKFVSCPWVWEYLF